MKPSDYIRKGWCQHDMCQDINRHCVSIDNPTAARWCLLGALEAATKGTFSIADYRKKLGVRSIAKWNDTPGRTQQEVIDLLESIGE